MNISQLIKELEGISLIVGPGAPVRINSGGILSVRNSAGACLIESQEPLTDEDDD